MHTTNVESQGRPSAQEHALETWLRERVVELERALDSIRRRQLEALDSDRTRTGDPDTGADPVFRHVLQRLPTPVLLLAEDDAVLFANTAAARFFGISFNASSGGTLERYTDAERAATLSGLRPSREEDAHVRIDALDGSGPALCHAFLAQLDGHAVRCVQIDWNPEARRGAANV